MTRIDKETGLLKNISELQSALQKLKLKLDLIAKWFHYNSGGLALPLELKDALSYTDLDINNLLNTPSYSDCAKEANVENRESYEKEVKLEVKEEFPFDEDSDNSDLDPLGGVSPPYSSPKDYLNSYDQSEISKDNFASDVTTKVIPKTKTLVVLLEDINKVGKGLRKHAPTWRLTAQRKIFQSKRYKCTICGQRFGKENLLRNHKKSAHNENQPYQCHHKGCEKCFLERQSLLRHMKEIHRDSYFEMKVKRRCIINKIDGGGRIRNDYQCSFEGCEKFFLDKQTLRKHQEDENHFAEISEAVEGKKYLCRSCRNLFSTREEVKEHVRSGCFFCSECNQVYSTKSELLGHLETHGNPFKCDYDGCNKVFISTYCLRMHKNKKRHFIHETEKTSLDAEISSCNIVTSESNESDKEVGVVQQLKSENDCSEDGTFVCPDCKLAFADRELLNNHIFHLCYKCKVCKNTFARDAELIDHDKNGRCHKKLKNKCDLKKMTKSEETKQAELLSCKVCEIVFSVDKDFEEHMKQHEVQLFHCRLIGCTRKFLTESEAEEHETAIHCQKCCKPFSSMAYFTEHNNKKHKGQSASYVLAAEDIQNKTNSTTGFICQKCKRFFNTVNQLGMHTKVGCWICDICGLVCRQNSNLQKHIAVTHKGEKSYLCSDCGKYYGSNYDLTKHRVQHVSKKDRKTFECLTCGKVLLTIVGYSQHMKTHEAGGAPRIQCSKCGFDFANEKTLKSHISAVHENQRPHHCHLCEKRFKTRTHLTTHIKTHDNPNGRKRSLNKDIDEFAAAAKRRNPPKRKI